MNEAREKAICALTDKVKALEEKLAICVKGPAKALTLEHDGQTIPYSLYLERKIHEYKRLMELNTN